MEALGVVILNSEVDNKTSAARMWFFLFDTGMDMCSQSCTRELDCIWSNLLCSL